MNLSSPAVVATTAMALVLVAASPSLSQQFTITPLEAGLAPIVAQLNPSGVQADKTVTWTHKKNVPSDAPTLEFSSGEPQTTSVDLLFDTSASGVSVDKAYLDDLARLAMVDSNLKRPPMVMFTWGTGFRPVVGVLDRVDVRYSLFLPDGTPTRATVTLEMKQTKNAVGRGGAPGSALDCTTDAECPAGQYCNIIECAPILP